MLQRLEVIDFLRGFSIFTIVLMHLLQSYPIPPFLMAASSFGGAGVHVFILCSGFGLHMAYIYSRATGLNYEGPALGVNFRCCLPDTSLGNKILNGLNLMAEYDARTINIGFNYAVWKDRFNLIAELNDGKYLSAGLYFKICLK